MKINYALTLQNTIHKSCKWEHLKKKEIMNNAIFYKAT
jgi:hypothetical protein